MPQNRRHLRLSDSTYEHREACGQSQSLDVTLAGPVVSVFLKGERTIDRHAIPGIYRRSPGQRRRISRTTHAARRPRPKSTFGA